MLVLGVRLSVGGGGWKVEGEGLGPGSDSWPCPAWEKG